MSRNFHCKKRWMRSMPLDWLPLYPFFRNIQWHLTKLSARENVMQLWNTPLSERLCRRTLLMAGNAARALHFPKQGTCSCNTKYYLLSLIWFRLLNLVINNSKSRSADSGSPWPDCRPTSHWPIGWDTCRPSYWLAVWLTSLLNGNQTLNGRIIQKIDRFTGQPTNR